MYHGGMGRRLPRGEKAKVHATKMVVRYGPDEITEQITLLFEPSY